MGRAQTSEVRKGHSVAVFWVWLPPTSEKVNAFLKPKSVDEIEAKMLLGTFSFKPHGTMNSSGIPFCHQAELLMKNCSLTRIVTKV